jgi:hypothetical protein
MLRRIGERKSKFFGTIDMTAGYHQILLAIQCRIYTAFVSNRGKYQWDLKTLRVTLRK